MDVNVRDVIRIKPIISEGEPAKEESDVLGTVEDNDDSESLLPVTQMNEKKMTPNEVLLPKARRKVQWNDNVGNKLAEVMEYQPSERSDSDDEESDACLCALM
ncbi:hypothetical protein Dimus_028550 [Dionaea muscipula]